MPSLLMMCLLTLGCVDDLPIYAAYVPHDQVLLQPVDTVDSNAPTDRLKAGNPKTVEKAPSVTLIDINQATTGELERLPGIGPAIAARIDAYRTKRKFRRIRDIRRVRGIGPSKFAKLKALITVNPP